MVAVGALRLTIRPGFSALSAPSGARSHFVPVQVPPNLPCLDPIVGRVHVEQLGRVREMGVNQFRVQRFGEMLEGEPLLRLKLCYLEKRFHLQQKREADSLVLRDEPAGRFRFPASQNGSQEPHRNERHVAREKEHGGGLRAGEGSINPAQRPAPRDHIAPYNADRQPKALSGCADVSKEGSSAETQPGFVPAHP